MQLVATLQTPTLSTLRVIEAIQHVLLLQGEGVGCLAGVDPIKTFMEGQSAAAQEQIKALVASHTSAMTTARCVGWRVLLLLLLVHTHYTHTTRYTLHATHTTSYTHTTHTSHYTLHATRYAHTIHTSHPHQARACWPAAPSPLRWLPPEPAIPDRHQPRQRRLCRAPGGAARPAADGGGAAAAAAHDGRVPGATGYQLHARGGSCFSVLADNNPADVAAGAGEHTGGLQVRAMHAWRAMRVRVHQPLWAWCVHGLQRRGCVC